MKILMTGGHLMPALALIDRLLLRKDIEIIFAGRKFNLDGEQSHSLEYQEINRRKIRFIPIKTGRVKRELSWNAFNNFFLIFSGLINAWDIIKKEKPEMIFSFGSYLGFPFTVLGWIRKIPVYTHEQTISPGLANRVSAFFCNKVFVSFPQTANLFNKKKVIVSGNPIRPEIFKITNMPFKITNNLPVIYVTGGSLGSHSLNSHIVKILPQLLQRYNVIHQSGNVKEYGDYQKLSDIKKGMSGDLQSRYFLREHIFTDEIGYIYSLADLVVCRAGANTFFELISLKKPAILIPLPWSANQEQQKQADLFALSGFGKVFLQSETSEKLLSLIDSVIQRKDDFKKNFINSNDSYKSDAVETIYKHIFQR